MFVDERAIIVQLRWVLWSQRARSRNTRYLQWLLPKAIWNGFVDYSRFYSASREGAWRWPVCFVASLILLLVDSAYECKTQQNATLTGQEEGDVHLKVSYFLTFGLF